MRGQTFWFCIFLLAIFPICTRAQDCPKSNPNCKVEKAPPPPPRQPAPEPRQTYTPPPPPPQQQAPQPRQTYTPPPPQPAQQPRQTYTPPPAQQPRQTYTPPPASQSAPRSGNPSAAQAAPQTSAPRTYTPGATSNIAPRSSPSSSQGGTTYTPRTYTPGNSSNSSAPAAGSNAGVRSNGVTTYTPHAGGTNNSSAAHPTSTSTPDRTVYTVTPSSVSSKNAKGDSVLTSEGSNSVLHQINVNRANLTGVNKKPIPSGQVTSHANGSLTVAGSGGRVYNVRPNGTLASFRGSGKSVTFNSKGGVSSVHTASMDVSRNALGQRTVVVRRPDKSVVVSTGSHSGYVQKTVVGRGGRTLIQRTYMVNGVRSTQLYNTYSFNGMTLNHYVPAFYYDPAFYGWAYYPWAAPIGYDWGWAGSPWYGYYNSYFSPWQTYPSPAYWLTDYFLGQTLSDAYQASLQNGQTIDADQGGGDQDSSDGTYAQDTTAITPDLKQAIAEEVQQQLAYENAAAAKPLEAANLDSLPQVLDPNHLFVVDRGLNIATADQQLCGLSAGDVLRLVATPQSDSQTAELTVAASRQSDCPAGAEVTVSLQDLENMQDNLRAKIDAGLQNLRTNQGHNGLPPAPKSAIAPPPRPSEDVPADTTNVQAALSAAQQDANQTESQAVKLVFPFDDTSGGRD
jgi:hypothetical protein